MGFTHQKTSRQQWRFIRLMALSMTALMIYTSDMSSAFAQACSNNGNAVHCLTCNCYFETRGESREGQLAVAATVLNRVRNPEFPNSACSVVYQKNKNSGKAEFSWVDDRIPNKMTDVSNKNMCESVARDAIANSTKIPKSSTAGYLFFHSKGLKANWSWAKRCETLGNHVFYTSKSWTCPRTTGSAAATRSRPSSPRPQQKRGAQ